MSRFYDNDFEIEHYGVKGMKWGKRKGKSAVDRAAEGLKKLGSNGPTPGMAAAKKRENEEKISEIQARYKKRMSDYYAKNSLRNQGYSSSTTPMDGDKLKQIKSLTKKTKAAKKEARKKKRAAKKLERALKKIGLNTTKK